MANVNGRDRLLAITPYMLGLSTDRVATVSNRVPALERSIQEIRADWDLL